MQIKYVMHLNLITVGYKMPELKANSFICGNLPSLGSHSCFFRQFQCNFSSYHFDAEVGHCDLCESTQLVERSLLLLLLFFIFFLFSRWQVSFMTWRSEREGGSRLRWQRENCRKLWLWCVARNAALMFN